MESENMNSLSHQAHTTTFRNKIALAMCPLAFFLAIAISGIGFVLGVRTFSVALILFWMLAAGALALALTARRQPLGKVAMIVSGITMGIGTIAIVALLAVTVAGGIGANSEVSTATMDHYAEMARQQAATPNARAASPASAPATGYRSVFINSVRLTDMQVAAIEMSYGTRVPDGRYWVDAFGNYGYEGGPALGNLGASAGVNYGGGAGNGGGAIRKGPLSSYDLTGVAVYDLR